MKTTLSLLFAGLLLGMAAPAFAHHSFAAEFDATKPVSLKGAVTRVEWLNPHVWLYVDVKDDNGAVSHWQCEGGAPNGLTRQGWSKSTLKPGDEIIIEGFRAKDATNTCSSRTVKLPDGRKIFVGNASEDGGPAAKAPKE
jgi:uncharacterized protein DUF6152